ncbi:hypothetical protein Tco_0627084 [Tanacetum coccineum]|uniref:Reverse transcriptase zinc-binding domain-containing protein n=1 Tax=Tanacetum coccineum TaxID=301880 RepID=A0ABQ4WLI2_9ASTR
MGFGFRILWGRRVKHRVSKGKKPGFARDRWRWMLSEDGDFKVKELSRLIEDKILQVENDAQETLWNKLVPKKVNVFIWRALKGLAMSVWLKIFNWWKMGTISVFTIGELFSRNGDVNIPTSLASVWQARVSAVVRLLMDIGDLILAVQRSFVSVQFGSMLQNVLQLVIYVVWVRHGAVAFNGSVRWNPTCGLDRRSMVVVKIILDNFTRFFAKKFEEAEDVIIEAENVMI